jgi:tungstate transport system substrate-binding protein
MRKLGILTALVVVAALVFTWRGSAHRGAKPGGGKALRLATTTSVKDSGLLADLLPAFERKAGYKVEVAAVGSGKAIELLTSGQADVAITHAPDEEQKALGAGSIGRRTVFMHNDFVIVGPNAPDGKAATLAGAGDIRDALRRIRDSGGRFLSRGDGSGTHRREKALWAAAGIPADLSFIEATRAGMGETLAKASTEKAFTLTDRSTFLAKRKGLSLVILFQGDDELRNFYAVLEPKQGQSGVDADGAKALTDFLRSPEGRAAIGGFGVAAYGEPLFTPED